jgi:hypothetical protein
MDVVADFSLMLKLLVKLKEVVVVLIAWIVQLPPLSNEVQVLFVVWKSFRV